MREPMNDWQKESSACAKETTENAEIVALEAWMQREWGHVDRDTLGYRTAVEVWLASAANRRANVAQGAEAIYQVRDDLRVWIDVDADGYERAQQEDRRIVYAASPAQTAITDAARDVLDERQRQVTAERWTPEHDDAHEIGELARAAACYAANATGYRLQSRINIWPWNREWWKPTAPRRDLVKAGALILAEIERLDRRALTAAQPASEGNHAG